MAINYENLIDIPNERVAIFVINFLRGRGIDTSLYSSSGIISTNLKLVRQYINSDLHKNQRGNVDERIDIEFLKGRIADSILPELHFDWLKSDPRATYWLWGKYYLLSNINGFSLKIQNAVNNGVLTHEFYVNNHSRFCHFSRYDSILFFFDTQVEANFDGKIRMLQTAYNEWKLKFMSEQPFKWLDQKHADMCRWAYSYIIQFQQKTSENDRANVSDAFSITEQNNSYSVTVSQPGSNEELYHAIFAMYDLWETTFERKKLFLIQINKAWNQKKVRQGRKGKKAINTFVSDESKLQLDFLAQKYNMKLSQVLEKLICEKFYDEQR